MGTTIRARWCWTASCATLRKRSCARAGAAAAHSRPSAHVSEPLQRLRETLSCHIRPLCPFALFLHHASSRLTRSGRQGCDAQRRLEWLASRARRRGVSSPLRSRPSRSAPCPLSKSCIPHWRSRAPTPAAPVIVVDKAKLRLLIRSSPKGLAAGPSGWTAELLGPLIEDDICLEGIALLIQLIANNQLDPHSRCLLTSSLLLGIPKPDSDALRPLAIGELFLKLAAKYCHDMDKGEHTGIFEPIQLALDSPSGAERAMQRVQAAIEASPTEHITLHLDCTNAFNTVDRAAMLSAVFGDQRLSSSWHVYSFAYGNPSSLLVRDHGHVAGSISSVRGVKQGCVLGSLGFARVMQPVYEACVAGLAVSAVAIMDDFTLTGPPAAVFSVFDRFVDLVRPLGIEVNSTKTKVQQAAGEPSELTAQLAADRGLEVVRGNHKCLGGLVGVDDQAAVAWLEAKLAKQTPVTRALRDSRFPSLLALQLAKISNIPKPMYLLRAMPLRITLAPITAFDQRNRHVLLPRLLRSSNPLFFGTCLSDSAGW